MIARRNLDQEFECLALNVYFEARGEPMTGKYAVAAVTLNRVVNPSFPGSICQVVTKAPASADPRASSPGYATAIPTGRATTTHGSRQSRSHTRRFFSTARPDRRRPLLPRRVGEAQLVADMVEVGRIGGHVFYREPASAENEVDRSRS